MLSLYRLLELALAEIGDGETWTWKARLSRVVVVEGTQADAFLTHSYLACAACRMPSKEHNMEKSSQFAPTLAVPASRARSVLKAAFPVVPVRWQPPAANMDSFQCSTGRAVWYQAIGFALANKWDQADMDVLSG